MTSTEPAPDPGPAQLQWDDDGQPISSQFDDVYFSRDSGINETRYVFLDMNRLPQRWLSMQVQNRNTFVIGETGFGTGLNFLSAWKLWIETAPQNAILHFVSVEKHPLRKADLIKTLSLWSELEDYAQELIQNYPVTLPGLHRIAFAAGRVMLTLIIDDAVEGFKKLLDTQHPSFYHLSQTKIDAWFLDGFAPAKNPEMWSESLFTLIKSLSQVGTTASTFTAASFVRKHLEQIGFSVNKKPGFGKKREMITAEIIHPLEFAISDTIGADRTSPQTIPWTLKSTKIRAIEAQAAKNAIVIGAGIAGCSTAKSLAERGYQVTLLEKNPHIAAEASGNPQGMLFNKFSASDSLLSQFYFHAFCYAQSYYRNLLRESEGNNEMPPLGDLCGLLQLVYNAREEQHFIDLAKRFSAFAQLVQFLNEQQASAIAGVPLQQQAIYLPHSGWFNLSLLCQHWVTHAAIKIKTNCESDKICWDESKNCWQILDKQCNEIANAPVVVIANSHSAKQFVQTEDLPLKTIRGQITYLATNSFTQQLKTVVCGGSYITPAQNAQQCIGATYNLDETTPQLRIEDHATNLRSVTDLIPFFADKLQPIAHAGNAQEMQFAGRVGFRCTTPDYLPIVGPVANRAAFLLNYARLRNNANASIPLPGDYLPGLYTNLAHGSKGLTSAPICAELLAAHINREPLPLAHDLVKALNPARFIIKNLIQRKI